jgi:O-antigen/teichoic acid export membrane protein
MASPPHGSGARGVFKNTTMLAIARVIERGTTLVLTLVIAAELGAAGLGTYATAMAVYGVIAIAGEAGTTMFLIRELSKDHSRTSSYVVHLSALAVIVSVVLMAASQLVVRHVGYSSEVETSVSVVLLAILPRTLNSIQEAVFIAHGRTQFETLTTFVWSVLYLGLSVVLLIDGYGIESLLIAYVVIQYVVTAVYYGFITRFIARLRWRFQWPLARRLLIEIKAFTASSALGALFARPEIIILSLLSTTEEVGYYSAAVRIAETWLFIPQVFMNNVFPLLSRSHDVGDDRFRSIQARAIKYTLAYALPLTAGMVAAADQIIPALFGDDFDASIDSLQLLAITVTLFSLISVLWRSLSARGRQDVVLRVQVVVIAARLGLATLLIIPLASLGAAIATMAGTALQLLLMARAARKHDARPDIFRLGWRLGAAALITGILTWLLGRWLELWLVVPAAVATYFAAVVLLRAFSADDLRLFRTIISPGRGIGAR